MSGTEKWELAYEDYTAGMKYKDIASKYDVSINTVKSWKSRKWNELQEGATTNKNVAHKTKKVAHKEEVQLPVGDDELSDQQKMFCLLYLRYKFNATKAYQEAYDVSYKVANANAYLLMVKHGIKTEIERLKEELRQGIHITIEDIINEYVNQFSADITDVVEVSLSEWKKKDEFGDEITDTDGNSVVDYSNSIFIKSSDEFDGSLVKRITQGRDGIAVELYDKQKAMDALVKYLGAGGGTVGDILIVDEWSVDDE